MTRPSPRDPIGHAAGGAHDQAPPAVLRVTDVAVRVGGGAWVLAGVSLTIAAGESVLLLGANGAGKSTLLCVLAGLRSPDVGRVEWFGSASRGPATRARIGLVGHELMVYRDLTVRENLELFARLSDVADPGRRARELMGTLNLEAWGSRPVSALSRGTSQRVALARALVASPELLLADEPCTGLDAESRACLVRCMESLHAAGVAVVMSSHDPAGDGALFDRVVTLDAGRVVEDRAARHEPRVPWNAESGRERAR